MRTKKGKPNIVVSDHQSAGQRQWVALHEVGHEMIARKVEFTDKFHLDYNDSVTTPLEKACNTFAALVLMPEHIIREWWKELKNNKEYRVQIMAERCGVSITAMQIRLKVLRLLR
jgi:Zn-dependent peptidase ImmA (M78 family)